MTQTTFSLKAGDVTRKWLLVDASSASLGHVATTVANYLIGKSKPTYTPHIDAGDYVVVINAANLKVSGNKEIDKKYYRHSGYPGGIKSLTLQQQRAKDPTKIIELAVKGMLPKNKLLALRMQRLKVFTGDQHAHTAQQPEKVEVK